MNAITRDHFALKEAPFAKGLPDDALWLPPSKAAAVDTICAAVKARENVLLTGEPGVGKTCVLRAVRHRLAQPDVRLTYCHNATLGRRDFYRQLCLALNLHPKATAAALFHAISSHVEELARDRIHPVFLLDEAHLLHQDTLDHLHILMNYAWDSQPLLSLILVGLPDLEDRMHLRRNRSLLSRMHRRIQLEALTVEDTKAYLSMRITRVGGTPDLFSDEAAAMLYEATLGNLRETDRLASLVLEEAATLDRARVERELVTRVASREG